MYGAAAGGLEIGAGNDVECKGRGGVNVRGVSSHEGGDEPACVIVVAVINRFPDALCYLVDLRWVARDGADGFVDRTGFVTGECSQWFGCIASKRTFESLVFCLPVVQPSDKTLMSLLLFLL